MVIWHDREFMAKTAAMGELGTAALFSTLTERLSHILHTLSAGL
jgi:hypothetical protein